jgi:hypothetical protein
MRSLTYEIEHYGPKRFSKNRILQEDELFEQRTALFYTPTANLPSDFIGHGPLNVWLPLASPTYLEYHEFRAFRSPRIWVDLLQRATGKVRWLPIFPAKVTLIRIDSYDEPEHNILAGAKSVIDALKVRTAGRRDGRLLYYFGAIADDNQKSVKEWKLRQEIVAHPSMAGTKILVEPL